MDVVSRKEKLEKLKEPFPSEVIKERDGHQGTKYKYIPNLHVIERLDNVFPLAWDWTVIDSGTQTYQFEKDVWTYNQETKKKEPKSKLVQGNVVYVHGRLSLFFNDGGPPVSRDAFGGSETGKGAGAGDDWKIAASNALSKAAYSFGIGAHIGFEEMANAPASKSKSFGNNDYQSERSSSTTSSKSVNPFR